MKERHCKLYEADEGSSKLTTSIAHRGRETLCYMSGCQWNSRRVHPVTGPVSCRIEPASPFCGETAFSAFCDPVVWHVLIGSAGNNTARVSLHVSWLLYEEFLVQYICPRVERRTRAGTCRG